MPMSQLSFERLARSGSYTAAITNTPGSMLGKGASLRIPTFALEEKSIAATGTMTSAIATLLHLSATIRNDWKMLTLLYNLSDSAQAFIDGIGQTTFGIVASELSSARYIFFAGERALAHVASEAALKMRETAEIFAESNSALGAFHGFLSAFGSRVPEVAAIPKAIVLFAEWQDGALANRYRSFANAHGAQLQVIACGEGCDFGYSMKIPASTAAEKLVLPIIFSQMLAHDLTVKLGIEPGASDVNRKVVK